LCPWYSCRTRGVRSPYVCPRAFHQRSRGSMTWESAEMILWKCRVVTMGPPSQTDTLRHRGCAPSLIPGRHAPATLCDAIILRPRCDANIYGYDGGRSCDSMHARLTPPPQSARPGRAGSALLHTLPDTERRPPVVYTGQSVKRFEDPRLLTGQGTFLDDLKFPGMLHAAILRSPHAHAQITSIAT